MTNSVFDELSDTDFFVAYGVDGSTSPLRKNISATSLRTYLIDPEEPGNVLNYGADATGESSSLSAFQDAIDSDYAVYVPYGDYDLSGGALTIPEEKTIVFERGKLPNYAGSVTFNDAVGSRVRLFKTDNTHFFEITHAGADLLGFPLLDVSGAASYTSAGVYYDCGNSVVRGWGGQIEVMALGNRTTIVGDGEGMRVIEVNWTGTDPEDNYLTMMKWFVNAQDVAYGLYLPEKAGLSAGDAQFANSVFAELYINGCKQAIYNKSFGSSIFTGIIQARDILHANEHPKAVVYNSIGNNIYDILPWDLSSDVSGSGTYRMSRPIDNYSKLTRVVPRSSDCRRSIQGYKPQFLESLYAPQGFIPWQSRSLADGYAGMTISALVNPFGGLKKRATTFVSAVYDGSEVADYEAETDDSVTAGITVSTDITLAGFDYFVGLSGGYPTATANATAVTNADYVEIHFSYTYRASGMWFSFSSNGGFSQIQVIRKASSVVVHNVLEDVQSQDDEDPQNAIFIDFSTSENCDETIIRLIGPRDSTKACTIQDICPVGEYVENRSQFITIEGGKRMFGPLIMDAGGGIVERMATSTELGDVSDAINTGTEKRLGFRVYNTTTKTDYVAQGSADASTWIDTSDGSTTITPS